MTESSFTRYRSLIPNPEEWWSCITQPLPNCCWANPLKTNPEAVAQWLKTTGVEVEPIAWYPGAFRSRNWSKPGETIAFAAGWYYVQEEIALTAVQVLDPQPGERVLDLCASPGGKTAQIAVRLAGTGMVIANELNIARLSSLRTTVARLGLLNVVITNHDGRTIPLPFHSFDRVLVDVPCSGEGTLRKNWNPHRANQKTWQPQHSQRIAAVQRQLLDRALQLVKPGGVIVYSTCTFAPEENEATLDTVLGDRGYLEPADIPGLKAIPGLVQWQDQSYRSDLVHARRYFPHFNDTGGFFVAKIRRTDAKLTTPTSPPKPLQPAVERIDDSPLMMEWCDRFGIAPDIFKDFQLWAKGKDKIWIAESTCQPPAEPIPQTIGIPLLRLSRKSYKPTTAALQRFGRHVTRNVIELKQINSVNQFLAGQQQACEATVDPGYVHVRYNDQELGCGLYRQGILESQVPKGLWQRMNGLGQKDHSAKR